MAGRHDPYGAFNFVVEIDGLAVAGFTQCSGLSSETEVIEYREGNEPDRMRKLPGLTRYCNVVLERGIAGDAVLWQWRKAIADGQLDRRTVTIQLLDQARSVVLRVRLSEAWPCKWTGPSLRAESNEVAIETLELVHEQLDVEFEA